MTTPPFPDSFLVLVLSQSHFLHQLFVCILLMKVDIVEGHVIEKVTGDELLFYSMGGNPVRSRIRSATKKANSKA